MSSVSFRCGKNDFLFLCSILLFLESWSGGVSFGVRAAGTDPWMPSVSPLETPRIFAATINYNDSLIVIGGCLDPHCAKMTSAAERFHNDGVSRILPNLPIKVNGPYGPEIVGIAGYSSVVTTGAKVYGPFLSYSEVEFAVHVVGPCSMYFSTRLTQAERLKFNSIWQMSEDLSTVLNTYHIQSQASGTGGGNIPTRVNASCVAYGSDIYIIGGVYMDSSGPLELTAAVDVYHSASNTYVHRQWTHPLPIMNAAVALDNVFMYVTAGMTSKTFSPLLDGTLLMTSGGSESWSDDASSTTPQPHTFPEVSPSHQMWVYSMPLLFIANNTQPLGTFQLNDNPFLSKNTQLGGLGRLFPFCGHLVMMQSATTYSTLHLTDPNHYPIKDIQWKNNSLGSPGPDPYVGLEPEDYTFPNIFGFSTRVGNGFSFTGTQLNLFLFGGVQRGQIQPFVFVRYLDIVVPGPLNGLPDVVTSHEPLKVEFVPDWDTNPMQPKSKYVSRLSQDPYCVTYVTNNVTYPVTYGIKNVYDTKIVSPKTYLCIGSYQPGAQQTFQLWGKYFFAVVNPFNPMHFEKFVPTTAVPTPSPPQKNSKSVHPKPSSVQGTVIFGTVLGILVLIGALGALVAFRRAKRLQLALEDGLLDDQDDHQTDSLVRNTTSDSKYKVIRRIGAGSFSTVFLVIRKTDGEQFALKFMACADDRERLDAIKECETINSLQGHPNVIQLFDMFMSYEFGKKQSSLAGSSSDALVSRELLAAHRESGLSDANGYGTLERNTPVSPLGGARQQTRRRERSDSFSSNSSRGSRSDTKSGTSSKDLPVHNRYLCLVMDYHPAGDLAHWVLNNHRDDGRGGLSEVVLISVAYQLLSVLKHLHGQKPPVVHRDLKPENVLLRGSPSPDSTFLPIVVTDFGLAFIQEENRKGGKGGGTRPYIAPECWKGGVCTASDMWSLGCVLYAVATQRVTADTVRVMFLDAKSPHFHEDIQYDLRVHRYSEKFARFVASLLIVDPKQRPTAAELLSRFSIAAGGTVENSSSVKFS